MGRVVKHNKRKYKPPPSLARTTPERRRVIKNSPNTLLRAQRNAQQKDPCPMAHARCITRCITRNCSWGISVHRARKRMMHHNTNIQTIGSLPHALACDATGDGDRRINLCSNPTCGTVRLRSARCAQSINVGVRAQTQYYVPTCCLGNGNSHSSTSRIVRALGIAGTTRSCPYLSVPPTSPTRAQMQKVCISQLKPNFHTACALLRGWRAMR